MSLMTPVPVWNPTGILSAKKPGRLPLILIKDGFVPGKDRHVSKRSSNLIIGFKASEFRVSEGGERAKELTAG